MSPYVKKGDLAGVIQLKMLRWEMVLGHLCGRMSSSC